MTALTAAGKVNSRAGSMNAPLPERLIDRGYKRLGNYGGRPRPRRCRTLFRHGRGPAGCVVRRPAGDLSQHTRPRPLHSMPSVRCSHRYSMIARLPTGPPGLRSRACGRLSAGIRHGPQRRRLARRHVHARYGVRVSTRFHHRSYGLGETVVQGAVNPDEFYVYKPALAGANARSA